MEKKFTQGEWVARTDATIDVIESKSGFGIIHLGNERELKECHYPISEAIANAKLISAAPDLLRAIEYYFDVLREVRGENWSEKPDHVLAKMLDAYKKATS